MQREECLVTLGFHLFFNSHMDELPWPPNPISLSPPKTSGAQQGSPLVKCILVQPRSPHPSTPHHQPLWHKTFALSLPNDFCRFLSWWPAKGKPGPPEEVGHMLSCVRLFATPQTVAHQASLFMGFSRQEYWSGPPRRVKRVGSLVSTSPVSSCPASRDYTGADVHAQPRPAHSNRKEVPQ